MHREKRSPDTFYGPPRGRYDYVAVGHVTRDLIEHQPGGGLSQPGGTAFYSALQAARLGLRTLIVTQGVREEIRALLAPYLDEFDLHTISAEHTTTLSTSGSGGARTQRVLAWAGPIVEQVELDAAILHLAPIARETPISWGGSADFIGITPQGLIRQWKDVGVPLVALDTGSLLGDIPTAPFDCDTYSGELALVDLDLALLPASFDAAVISKQECHSCHELFSAARRHSANVAVTAGSRPTTVHLGHPDAGADVVQSAIPPGTALLDDLGAGDVFAAAFFIALAGGDSPLRAAGLGNAAAGVRIAGVGPNAIGRRAEIESLAKDTLAG